MKLWITIDLQSQFANRQFRNCESIQFEGIVICESCIDSIHLFTIRWFVNHESIHFKSSEILKFELRFEIEIWIESSDSPCESWIDLPCELWIDSFFLWIAPTPGTTLIIMLHCTHHYNCHVNKSTPHRLYATLFINRRSLSLYKLYSYQLPIRTDSYSKRGAFLPSAMKYHDIISRLIQNSNDDKFSNQFSLLKWWCWSCCEWFLISYIFMTNDFLWNILSPTKLYCWSYVKFFINCIIKQCDRVLHRNSESFYGG